MASRTESVFTDGALAGWFESAGDSASGNRTLAG